MADEAFALSLTSAHAAKTRAVTPSEADYDAIREALMETERGRWFLGEYAKRSRNANTTMVLDAVARIAETLAAQRRPVAEDRLPEALAAIRRAVAITEAAASAAFDRAAIERYLEPIQRGVRIIMEISLRWRAIGADGRICDVIDSQLVAMERACEQISTIDPQIELKAAFGLLRNQLAQTATTAPSLTQEIPEIADKATEEPAALIASEASASIAETSQVDTTVGTEAGANDTSCDNAAAEAEDDAILELIAVEMAAPDIDPDLDFDEAVTEPVVAQFDMSSIRPEGQPIAAKPIKPTNGEVVTTAEGSLAVTERSGRPQPSLGSTILASGLLQKPWVGTNDPLEPIRRMTQAEKIAFFS